MDWTTGDSRDPSRRLTGSSLAELPPSRPEADCCEPGKTATFPDDFSNLQPQADAVIPSNHSDRVH